MITVNTVDTIKKLEDSKFENVREDIYKLAKNYPKIFVEIFGDNTEDRANRYKESVLEFIRENCTTYSKIPLIKFHRMCHDSDLKTSKKIIEDICGDKGYGSDVWDPTIENMVHKLKKEHGYI